MPNSEQWQWLLVGGLAGGGFTALFLRERFARMRDRLAAELAGERALSADRSVALERMHQHVGELTAFADAFQALDAQSRHLVDTLRSPVVRGQWGEMQLRRVCELAQMMEHVDFDIQVSVRQGDRVQRPDAVVHLPLNRSVVVDAKAPMDAFLEALEASTEEERTDALRRHARQVRDIVVQLSARQYWEQFALSPEFVVLFLPGESLFAAACQYDARLIEFAADRRVILASPTTLIALLRGVAQGWQHVAMSENSANIAEAGHDLAAQLWEFSAELERVRRGLERSGESYNAAVGRFERSITPLARRLSDLTGATVRQSPLPLGTALRRPLDERVSQRHIPPDPSPDDSC